MKKYILILFLLVGSVFLLQDIVTAQAISYSYDASGSRIVRRVISLLKSAKVSDSAKVETYKQEIIEEQLGEQKILIYPNPVREDLKIEIQGSLAGSRVIFYLYNQGGKLLKTQIIEGSSSFNVNLSAYPAGVYILRLSVSNNVREWKIIKE